MLSFALTILTNSLIESTIKFLSNLNTECLNTELLGTKLNIYVKLRHKIVGRLAVSILLSNLKGIT